MFKFFKSHKPKSKDDSAVSDAPVSPQEEPATGDNGPALTPSQEPSTSPEPPVPPAPPEPATPSEQKPSMPAPAAPEEGGGMVPPTSVPEGDGESTKEGGESRPGQ